MGSPSTRSWRNPRGGAAPARADRVRPLPVPPPFRGGRARPPAPSRGARLRSQLDRLRAETAAFVATPPVPERIAGEVRIEQARQLSVTFPLIALAGLNTLAVLEFGFVGGGITGPAAAPALLIASTYVWVLGVVWRWIRDPGRVARTPVFLGRLTLLTAALGIGWASLSIVLAFGDGAERSLLFGIDVGVVSSAALLTPRRLLLACWAPATLGGVIASLALGSGMPWLVAAAFLAYALMVLLLAQLGNRGLVLRIASRAEVDEQREVIQLLLRDFEQNASDWLLETDDRLRLTRVSRRLAEVTAMEPAALHRLSFRSLVASLTRGVQDRDSTELLRRLDARLPVYGHEIRVRVAGEDRHWTITCEPVRDRAGRFQGYRGVGSDVTSLRVSAREIAFLARHDLLTGLPNRRLVAEQLDAACAGTGEAGGVGFCLLCIDLDGFKDINDRFGHAGGDAVLVVVAQRLRDSVRQGDVVARLGGDEFAILLHAVEEAEVVAVVRRILATLSTPLQIQGVRVQVGASIGVASAPRDANDADTLMHDADLALYRAKAAGRNTWRRFEGGMAVALALRQNLEEELRRAIAGDELFLRYRPVRDLASGGVVGAAAMIGWAHPTRGELPEAEFVPVAARSPLILELGAWMLRRATREATGWAEATRLTVGLAPMQLRDPSLGRTVEQALAGSGLAPGRLELAIPAAAPRLGSPACELLAGLREIGVRIALDDFGGGLSALSDLRGFRFDRLRIGAPDAGARDPDAAAEAAILRAVIELGRSLAIEVVVDRVEDAALLPALREAGVRLAQGGALDPPVPTEALRPPAHA